MQVPKAGSSLPLGVPLPLQPRSLRRAGTVPAGSLSRCVVQARFLLESEERNYCIFLKKLWDGEGRGGEEPLILIQNSKMSSLVRARSLLSKLNTRLARGLASEPPWLISSKLKGQNHVGSFFRSRRGGATQNKVIAR